MPVTDEILVARLVDGDQDALGTVYDRYADRIHDFCARMLHDPDAAADATHDTFLVAARRAETLRDRSKLRAWLYAIARTQCLGRLRARRRTEPSEDLEPMLAGDQPGRGAEQADVAALVHAAAAGLEERDRAALHLHLRHDLDGQALADALGVTPANARKIAQRVRDRLERSLTALLVARKGSDDCDELAAILGDWDGELTPLLRKRVARHVDRCEVCDEHRRGALTPAALLSAIPLAPAPSELRGRLISSWRAGEAPSTSAGRQRWEPSGFPSDGAGGGAAWFPVAVAALVVSAAFLGGAILGVVRADGSPVVEAMAATTSTSEPPGSTTSTTVVGSTTTTTATTEPTTTTSGVAVVDPPPVTAPEDRTPPSLAPAADPPRFRTDATTRSCTDQPTTATVSSGATDDGGIAGVRFRWVGPSATEQRLVTDAPFEVTVGPYPASTLGNRDRRTILVDIEAVDEAGNVSVAAVELTLLRGTCIG